jgi:hypothetical protein
MREAEARSPGFILGPIQSIAYGTKYDNFMALLAVGCNASSQRR